MNEPLSELLVAGLGGLVVRTSLLLIVALCATHLMRQASAAARHLVWAAALAGAIAMPIVTPLLPGLRIPLPVSALPGLASTLTAARTLVGGQVADGSTEQARVVEAARSRSGIPITTGLGWMEWALVAWAGGALAMVARLVISLAGVRALASRATRMTDGPWVRLAHELARRLGLDRRVTLMQGDRGRVPMTWGVVRPVIWLPAEAETWTHERREVVLAHELAHVHRRDALTQWLGHLAVALYWFNPLVWLAARRLHEERERACDDAVLRMGAAPIRYAEHLLQVVRTLGGHPAPRAAMAMARRSHFEGRIRAILERSTARDSITPRRALGIVALALTCMIPVAALRADGGVAAAPETPTRPGDGQEARALLATEGVGSGGEGAAVQEAAVEELGDQPREVEVSAVPASDGDVDPIPAVADAFSEARLPEDRTESSVESESVVSGSGSVSASASGSSSGSESASASSSSSTGE